MTHALEGRRVLVTGGTKGIGYGIAHAFAEHGASVVVTGRSDAEGRRAASELGALGTGDASFVSGDVGDPAAISAMVEVALLRLGGLDVVSANAGIYPESDVADMALDELDRVLNVNLRGTILTVQACLPALRRSTAGRVIVTSSITGIETGIAGMAHYGASKAGQVGFVRSAALELAPDGITINAVLPGNIRTEGLEALGHDYLAAMEASVPVGRLGTPLDIARAVMFFAEESASFITGQTLILDGGQVLPESASSMR